jgi:hypothetical protein
MFNIVRQYYPVAPEFIAVLFSRPGRARESILKSVRNLAMDDTLVRALWQGPLADHIAQYLDVERPGFVVDKIVEKCFATLFYMARSVHQDAYARLARLVPAVVYIVGEESPLKDFAVTLLLECAGTHGSRSPLVRQQLRASGAIEKLFALLKTHPRKEDVVVALEQWCSSEPAIVQAEIVARVQDFGEALADVFENEFLDVQVPVAKSLLGLCDRSRLLARELSRSLVLGVVIANILESDLSESPELRVTFVSLVLSCYEATTTPKQMIARFRLLAVAQKMSRDGSAAVQSVARQLQQAVASNYIL